MDDLRGKRGKSRQPCHIFPASRGERPRLLRWLPGSRGGRGLLCGLGLILGLPSGSGPGPWSLWRPGLCGFWAWGPAWAWGSSSSGPNRRRRFRGAAMNRQADPLGRGLDGRLFHPGIQVGRHALGPHRTQPAGRPRCRPSKDWTKAQAKTNPTPAPASRPSHPRRRQGRPRRFAERQRAV